MRIQLLVALLGIRRGQDSNSLFCRMLSHAWTFHSALPRCASSFLASLCAFDLDFQWFFLLLVNLRLYFVDLFSYLLFLVRNRLRFFWLQFFACSTPFNLINGLSDIECSLVVIISFVCFSDWTLFRPAFIRYSFQTTLRLSAMLPERDVVTLSECTF